MVNSPSLTKTSTSISPLKSIVGLIIKLLSLNEASPSASSSSVTSKVKSSPSGSFAITAYSKVPSSRID